MFTKCVVHLKTYRGEVGCRYSMIRAAQWCHQGLLKPILVVISPHKCQWLSGCFLVPVQQARPTQTLPEPALLPGPLSGLSVAGGVLCADRSQVNWDSGFSPPRHSQRVVSLLQYMSRKEGGVPAHDCGSFWKERGERWMLRQWLWPVYWLLVCKWIGVIPK